MKAKSTIYKECMTAMANLDTKTILKGCRTFERHGVIPHITSSCCFVGEICDNNGLLACYATIKGMSAYNPHLSCLSMYHYDYPEIVFLAACDILEQRKYGLD